MGEALIIRKGSIAKGDAVEINVLSGKSFSNGTSTGLVGTMPNRGAVSITPSTVNQAIQDGYHSGSGIVYGDSNLISGNIINGVNIFGVSGSAVGASGNAVEGDVLSGKTFSKSGGNGLTGAMPNNGTVNITPSTVNQSIPQGYHNGAGIVSGDSDLIASNIKSGINIFGVSGNLVEYKAVYNPSVEYQALGVVTGYKYRFTITGISNLLALHSLSLFTPSSLSGDASSFHLIFYNNVISSGYYFFKPGGYKFVALGTITSVSVGSSYIIIDVETPNSYYGANGGDLFLCQVVYL